MNQVLDHNDELALLEKKWGKINKSSVEYQKLKALNKLSKRNRRKLREELKQIYEHNNLGDF